jgi:hypothetical protein
MNKRFTSIPLRLLAVVVAIFGILLAPSLVGAAENYGDGTYGSCQYNTCGITFGADASVALDVTPNASGAATCTVARVEAQVATESSTGYSLTMGDNDASANMVSGASTIPTQATANSASPAVLTANRWGYRVDGTAGFGSGPTSAVSSGTVPSVTFAKIQTGTPDVITNSASPASPYASTFIWYGVCADTTTPSGSYTDDVVYTAVVN